MQCRVLILHSSSVLQYESSPLHWACQYGHDDVIAALIEAGAEVEAEDQVIVLFLLAYFVILMPIPGRRLAAAQGQQPWAQWCCYASDTSWC